MRWAAFITLALFALFLKITMFSHLEVAGVRPEAAVLVVLFIALHTSPKEAALVGWSAGMLQDLLSGGALGTNALSFMIVCLAASRFQEYIFTRHLLTQVLIAVPAGALVVLAAVMRLVVLSPTFDLAAALESGLVVTLYTAFLAPFVFGAMEPVRRHMGLITRRDALGGR